MVHNHAESFEQPNSGVTASAGDTLVQQSFSDRRFFSEVMHEESARKDGSISLPDCEISNGDSCEMSEKSQDVGRSSYAELGYRPATPDSDPTGELQQRLVIEGQKSERTNQPDGSITHHFKDGSFIHLGADGSATYIDPEGHFVGRSMHGQLTSGRVTQETLKKPGFNGKVSDPELEFERRVVFGSDKGEKTELADGSISRKFKDGSTLLQGADGSYTFTDAHRNVSKSEPKRASNQS